jgi:magnesium-transporting ATPase (P-type)
MVTGDNPITGEAIAKECGIIDANKDTSVKCPAGHKCEKTTTEYMDSEGHHRTEFECKIC